MKPSFSASRIDFSFSVYIQAFMECTFILFIQFLAKHCYVTILNYLIYMCVTDNIINLWRYSPLVLSRRFFIYKPERGQCVMHNKNLIKRRMKRNERKQWKTLPGNQCSQSKRRGGKSISRTNLGAGLARRGQKVLVVDLDSQASQTVSLGWRLPDELPVTVATQISRVIENKQLNPLEGILHHDEGVDLMPPCR